MLLQLEKKFVQSRQLLAGTRQEFAEKFAVTTCAEHPELFDASVALENEVWDELSFLDNSGAHHAHYDYLLKRFPEYHLSMVELGSGEVVATGVCVPLHLEANAALPDEGWDWAVETAAQQDGWRANTVSGLTVSVHHSYRNSGLARDVINTMRALAAMNNIANVIIPVRPSEKAAHPFVPMQEYIGWRESRGQIFDPWLRSQIAAGGKIVGVCEKSMVVDQGLDFWQDWTSDPLDRDGAVTVKGALAPVQVDVSAGTGRYVEPNVWVRHSL